MQQLLLMRFNSDVKFRKIIEDLKTKNINISIDWVKNLIGVDIIKMVICWGK